MYGSAVFKECRVCPENSESLELGLSACTCDEDYYRAAREEDLPCTRELIMYSLPAVFVTIAIIIIVNASMHYYCRVMSCLSYSIMLFILRTSF